MEETTFAEISQHVQHDFPEGAVFLLENVPAGVFNSKVAVNMIKQAASISGTKLINYSSRKNSSSR